MKFVFSNNVSTLLHEELSANASEMRTQKLPEGIHWPSINNSEGEVAPCTIIDPATRAWEIVYVKEVIDGLTYDTLKITRGEEETGPNSFSKNSRVELRVTAGSLYANAQNLLGTIPTATKTVKGLVKVGKNLNVTQDGEISVPTASKTEAGAVKVGNNLKVDTEGNLSVPMASSTEAGVVKLGEGFVTDASGDIALPIATTTEAGIIKVGDKLLIDNGTLNNPIASKTTTGIVKVGDRLNVTSDGTLSAPSASSTVEGMVKIGEGLEFDVNGALVTSVKELPTATTAKAGIVQLSSATNSTSETLAATAKAVKAAWDKAASAATTASTPATTSSLGVVRIGQGISVDANGIISTTPVSAATTTNAGIVQLSSAVNSTSETLAATPKAVKAAYDKASAAASALNPWDIFPLRVPIPVDGVRFGGSDGRRAIMPGETTARENWIKCDGGTDGRGGTVPNLQGRMILGASSSYSAGSTGGSGTHSHSLSGTVGATTLTEAQLASHTHSTGLKFGKKFGGSGLYGLNGDTGTLRLTESTGNSSSHTHSLAGSFGNTSSLPPYYALSYIMRVA